MFHKLKGLLFVPIIALSLVGAPAAFAQMQAADPMVGGAAMDPSKTIVQNALNSPRHTTLVAAVRAAGLVDTLSGAGPLTVSAPTKETFAKLPAGTVDTLVWPEDKKELTNIPTRALYGPSGDFS